MIVQNEDRRPRDYGNSTMDMHPRPSHADWTYLEKYGVKASSGGGRSSAMLTAPRSPPSPPASATSTSFPPIPEHPTPSTNPAFLSLLNTVDRKTVDDPPRALPPTRRRTRR